MYVCLCNVIQYLFYIYIVCATYYVSYSYFVYIMQDNIYSIPNIKLMLDLIVCIVPAGSVVTGIEYLLRKFHKIETLWPGLYAFICNPIVILIAYYLNFRLRNLANCVPYLGNSCYNLDTLYSSDSM